jgi:hypothetical protein
MMMVEPNSAGLKSFDSTQPVVISSVNYSGPTKGSFFVLAQEPFLKALAANLLDGDDAEDSTFLIDGAKEVANLLSGNLLTELFGTERAYALDAPSISTCDISSLHDEALPHLICFTADECPIALYYTLGV